MSYGFQHDGKTYYPNGGPVEHETHESLEQRACAAFRANSPPAPRSRGPVPPTAGAATSAGAASTAGEAR